MSSGTYISNVPIASIQNLEISSSSEIDEIDLIEKDFNSLVYGNDEGKDIEIEFTLNKQSHPEKLDIEKQRGEVKDLVSNQSSDNPIRYDGYEGFISIESVDIPESSDLINIAEGSISGKFLSWPKNYTSSDVSFNKRNSGDILYQLRANAISSSGKYINGDIFVSQLVGGNVNQVESLNSNFSFSELVFADINNIDSLNSNSTFNFNLGDSTFGRNFGRIFGTGKVSLNQIDSINSSVQYSLNSTSFSSLIESSSGKLDYYLYVEGEIKNTLNFDSTTLYSLSTSSLINKNILISSDVLYSFNLTALTEKTKGVSSTADLMKDIIGDPSVNNSINSSVNYGLTTEGVLEIEKDGFGRKFGTKFGS